MSIKNLLSENNYVIHAGAIDVPSLDVNELVLVNSVDDTKKVELSSNNNNTLVLGPTGNKGLLASNIQFNTNQDLLNYYSVMTSSEANALQVTTPIATTVNLTNTNIKFSRIGNIVVATLPDFNTLMSVAPFGNRTTPYQLVSAIPSRFIPSTLVVSNFSYISTNFEEKVGIVSIDNSGIIRWVPNVGAAGAPGVWDSTASSTSIDVFRSCISYCI